MTTFKKHKVILLPTDKESKIFKDVEDNIFLNEELDVSGRYTFAQHLYILSDEEIKEGEWILVPSTDGRTLFDFSESKPKLSKDSFAANKFVWKIIASTDKSLIEDTVKIKSLQGKVIIHKVLPQPTDEFIKSWIEAGYPEEIEVEYTGDYDEHYGGFYAETVKLLINPDNTINCRLIQEDSWDEIFDKYPKTMFTGKHEYFHIKNWLKENYEVPKKLK